MRTLLVLLAAMLALGNYFAGDELEPSPDIVASYCLSATCRYHAPYRDWRTPGGDPPVVRWAEVDERDACGLKLSREP